MHRVMFRVFFRVYVGLYTDVCVHVQLSAPVNVLAMAVYTHICEGKCLPMCMREEACL